MNKAKPGDIVKESELGRGLVMYYESPGRPAIAFPENFELVLSSDELIEVICPIGALKL